MLYAICEPHAMHALKLPSHFCATDKISFQCARRMANYRYIALSALCAIRSSHYLLLLPELYRNACTAYAPHTQYMQEVIISTLVPAILAFIKHTLLTHKPYTYSLVKVHTHKSP